nr:prolyl oligopeptidase family serine peptidase [Devriesea agamarum]
MTSTAGSHEVEHGAISEAGVGAILPAPDGSSDPWIALEDVDGEQALSWVQERNARAERELDADGLSSVLADETLAILNSKDKIPGVVKRGDYLYNFWTDADHIKGVWRRTTMESYRTDQPDWEVLIDVDALNEQEGEDWVWHGATVLRPRPSQPGMAAPYRHALIRLSHGGSDSDVTREFDLVDKRFVAEDNGGFVRPDAKGSMDWIDEDTVFVSTDFGPGSMSLSGYPRQVRRWTRGTPLNHADLIFEADETDMMAYAVHESSPGFERDWVVRMRAFYDTEQMLLQPGESERLVTLDIPSDVEIMPHRDLICFMPRMDWTVGEDVYPAGSLVVCNLDDYLAGERRLTLLFEPSQSASLEDVTLTRHCVVLTILEDVKHRLEVHVRDDHGGWVRSDLYPDLPGSLSVSAVDADETDELWVSASGFLEPTTLWMGDIGPVSDGGQPGDLVRMKSAPATFDASGLEVTQHFAVSEDGTRIPYFQIGHVDASPAEKNPTLLYGYGGFEISLTPAYPGAVGKTWLERGGTYVLANIRGGGEYGPTWHQAALKEKRHKAYEDFAAVARDLIERGVTVTERLACRGGSNGGLLTGNMLAQYPELFGAVVIQVPLLDMKRYSHLLAGASWMAEYGDPDTEDWNFIRTFSPYHLLREDVTYPSTFVTTSTRDDRVHPGHARKLVAALESMGQDVRFWENIEGGHGGAATNEQAARMNALIHTFLWQTIGAGL